MDMDSELAPILAGMARHVLTTAGGALVTSGYMQSSEMSAFVGGGMVVIGVVWAWWNKVGQRRAIAILARMKPVASPGASNAEAAKAGMDAVKAAGG